jgi:hypothetical protein
MSDALETVASVLSIVGGGGVLSILWTWQSDRLAQYRYLDEVYTDLLEQYREKPEFGDHEKTATFETAFAKERNAYHYFAMTVHNTMETIFDVYDERPLDKPQWARIFETHALLHRPWLIKHSDAFEDAYVDYVMTRLPTPERRTPIVVEPGALKLTMPRRKPKPRDGFDTSLDAR